MRWLWLPLVLALGLTCSEEIALAPQEPELRGRVLDAATGRPLTGITVRVRTSPWEEEQQVETDREGCFHSPALPRMDGVAVYHPPYEPWVMRPFLRDSLANELVIRLEMTVAPEQLWVRVRDAATGLPIPEVWFRPEPVEARAGGLYQLPVCYSRYPRERRFEVGAPGYFDTAPSHPSTRESSSQDPVEIHLHRRIDGTGRVESASGSPLVNAKVRWVPEECGHLADPKVINREHETRTDEHGVFRLAGLPAGTTGSLVFSAKGHRFRLIKRVTLRATTLFEFPPVRLARSYSDPPAQEFLEATDSSKARQAPTCSIAGSVVDHDQQHVGGAKVRARLQDDVRDNRGYSRESTDPHPTTVCDEKGRFQFDGLVPGEYRLISWHGLLSVEDWSEPVEVAPGSHNTVAAPLELRPPTGVAGSVVRARDGSPLTRFEISFTRRGGSCGVGGRRRASVSRGPNSNGTYFLPLDPGIEVKVTARADGFADWVSPVLVPAAGEIREAQILMAPLKDGAVILGKVVDETGRPVPALEMVFIHESVVGELGHPHTITDAQGRFELRGLAHGTYSLFGLLRRATVSGPQISLEEGASLDSIELEPGKDYELKFVLP